MIDLGPPPQFWLPKPAIIRPAEFWAQGEAHRKKIDPAFRGTFPFPIPSPKASGGGGGGSDPYFSSVVLLLGFEGTNGATTTTDESSKGHSPITFNGSAQIDTSQKPFGGSSLKLVSGSYLSIPDSLDWQLAAANSDPWTIEFWMRLTSSSPTTMELFGQSPGVGNCAWYIETTNGTQINFNYAQDGSNIISGPAAGGMSLSNWHYVAISKNASGKLRAWHDGTLGNSVTPAQGTVIYNSTAAFEIGRLFGSANFTGNLKEIRITKGVCRYDTDGSISVPTAAFPRS